jgi:hypothetical protein
MLEEQKSKSQAPKTPFWKRKWVWVIAGLFILGAIGRALPQTDAGASDGSSDSSSSGNVIGDAVKSGKLTYTVNSINCGISTEGISTALGQFCEVDMSVENTGKKELTLYAEDEHLYDAKGRKYTADSGTMISIDNPLGIAQAIGAGETAEGIILYDIPADATPDYLRVYNSQNLLAVTHKISLK